MRIRKASGGWQDVEPEKRGPAPFERSDGTVMTQEEIAKVAKGDETDFTRKTDKAHSRKRLSDEQLEEAWQLAAKIGRPEAAAKLGLTLSGLISRLGAHQERQRAAAPDAPPVLPPELEKRLDEVDAEEDAAEQTDRRIERTGEPVELTDQQAKTVLVGIGYEGILDAIEESGFDLVIRLRQDAAA